jgi:hypothetical protein
MIEEIKKHKPEGATHWKSGEYYKVVCDQEVYELKDGEWVFKCNIDDNRMMRLCLTNILR